MDAIVAASEVPMIIIVVGIGDSEDEWEQMNVFDDHLPRRKL